MRALRLATATARRLDHAVGRLSGQNHILIDVRTPMNLAVLRPMWRQLADDPRVVLTFAAEDERGVRTALVADNLAGRLISPSAARWRRFDLAITADAWNRTPLTRCRRTINFFHGVAGKYDLDDPARLRGAGFHDFDRLAFINADRLDRYVRAGVVSREHAALIGFPKLDDLLNGRWSPDATRRSLNLDPSIDTVLYAPTFSTANSLHLAGEAIIESLLATGRNVIVKLHDRSMVPTARYTGGVDWPGRLAAFRANPRFALAPGADSAPYLAAAHALVTDHSSAGFEFALLDRPIIVFDAPSLREAARIDAGKWELLRSMADVVTSAEELPPVLAHALTHRGHRAAGRHQARALFAYPGSATRRALDVIYDLLDLPHTSHAVLRRHRHA